MSANPYRAPAPCEHAAGAPWNDEHLKIALGICRACGQVIIYVSHDARASYPDAGDSTPDAFFFIVIIIAVLYAVGR
jgi:hypothetical protein